MKKFLSLLLAMVMVMSFFGCSSSDSEAIEASEATVATVTGTDNATEPSNANGEEMPDTALQVGFGRQAALPQGYEVHIAGGNWAGRTTTEFIDEIAVTCVAFRQGGETLLYYTMDFLGSKEVSNDPAKDAISAETGVPVENIWMNATHTHAGPAVFYEWPNGNTAKYRDTFNKACVKAATQAIKDLAPAEMYYGGVQTENMTFVRHYKMADGTVAGANFGSFASSIEGHTKEADQELQLINFVREDDKDILLLSFPSHCTMNQSITSLSADFPGVVRTHIEESGDYKVAFFQGSSGDQVPSSRIAGEEFSSDYRVYGKELARYALEALDAGLTKSETSDLKLTKKVYVGNSNKEGVERLADARAVQAVIDQYGKTSGEAKAAAAQYGFSSVYASGAVITRSKMEDLSKMELRAFAVGDVGFVVAPYEMFGYHGQLIKEQSPYAMTFISTLGEGDIGYLPTLEAAEYACYESEVSIFERGTGDKAADEFIAMLNGLKNS